MNTAPTPQQKAQAHALLDRARAGASVSRAEIEAALIVTGDLCAGMHLFTRRTDPATVETTETTAS